MIKFMLVALGVMLLMQSYVSWHVWRVLPFSTPVKITILLIMLAALACMVLQFKSDGLPLNMATAMYEIGNSWLIIMFYLLMAFLLLDIGRMVHLIPAAWLKGNAITSIVLTGVMQPIKAHASGYSVQAAEDCAVTFRAEAPAPKSTPDIRIQLPSSPRTRVSSPRPSTVIPASCDIVEAGTVR